MHFSIQNYKRAYKVGKESLMKSLISSISPLLVLFQTPGCGTGLGRGQGSWSWVTARLCPSLVCSNVKYLILGRAEGLGHLGLAVTHAKLSLLIISRAAAARVHRFSPCTCQVPFPFMHDAGD